MFSVLSNQAHVKYNYFEILSYPSQQNLSSRNQVIKMLVMIWGNGGPHSLLVDVAIMEIGMKHFQKAKSISTT